MIRPNSTQNLFEKEQIWQIFAIKISPNFITQTNTNYFIILNFSPRETNLTNTDNSTNIYMPSFPASNKLRPSKLSFANAQNKKKIDNFSIKN